jgi:hypothetical protein
MVENFKLSLSDDDEVEKSVIASLDHVAAKLAEVQASIQPEDFLHPIMCQL